MAKTTRQIIKEADLEDSDASRAVVAYRVGQLEAAVTQGFKEHNEKLDTLVQGFVTKEFYIEQHTTLKNRVTSLENDRKWIVRLVVGAVCFALLALIGVGFKLNS